MAMEFGEGSGPNEERFATMVRRTRRSSTNTVRVTNGQLSRGANGNVRRSISLQPLKRLDDSLATGFSPPYLEGRCARAHGGCHACQGGIRP